MSSHGRLGGVSTSLCHTVYPEPKKHVAKRRPHPDKDHNIGGEGTWVGSGFVGSLEPVLPPFMLPSPRELADNSVSGRTNRGVLHVSVRDRPNPNVGFGEARASECWLNADLHQILAVSCCYTCSGVVHRTASLSFLFGRTRLKTYSYQRVLDVCIIPLQSIMSDSIVVVNCHGLLPAYGCSKLQRDAWLR